MTVCACGTWGYCPLNFMRTSLRHEEMPKNDREKSINLHRKAQIHSRLEQRFETHDDTERYFKVEIESHSRCYSQFLRRTRWKIRCKTIPKSGKKRKEFKQHSENTLSKSTTKMLKERIERKIDGKTIIYSNFISCAMPRFLRYSLTAYCTFLDSTWYLSRYVMATAFELSKSTAGLIVEALFLRSRGTSNADLLCFGVFGRQSRFKGVSCWLVTWLRWKSVNFLLSRIEKELAEGSSLPYLYVKNETRGDGKRVVAQQQGDRI